MPKLGTGTIIPTPQEDAVITAAADADRDARPFTDAEWQAVINDTLKRSIKAGKAPEVKGKLRTVK